MPDVVVNSEIGAPAPRRRYDASGRRAKAQATRAAIYRAAFELFSVQGYTRTTIAQVASAAGVSVETVQKIGPKSALLDGARLIGVFGVDRLDDIDDAAFMKQVAASTSLDEAVEVMVAFYAESNARSAGFWITWRAAALDDEKVAEAWRDEMAGAHRAFLGGIDLGLQRGWLRTDVSREELAASLWLLGSAETYARMVTDAGLSDDDYRRWLRRSMLEQLGRR